MWCRCIFDADASSMAGPEEEPGKDRLFRHQVFFAIQRFLPHNPPEQI
jgi:hypothetical protein